MSTAYATVATRSRRVPGVFRHVWRDMAGEHVSRQLEWWEACLALMRHNGTVMTESKAVAEGWVDVATCDLAGCRLDRTTITDQDLVAVAQAAGVYRP